MGNGRKPFYYGWVIVGATWLVYFFINDPPCYGTNVISAKLITEFGWSESVAGLSLSFHYLAIGLAAIPIGWLIQRFGTRKTIIAGSLLGAACYLALLRTDSELMYEVLFFALGLSVSACASVSCPSLVNAWFKKNKALPMAILMTAGGIGGFLFPIMSERLTAIKMSYPWTLYFVMSMIACLLAVIVIRDEPHGRNEEKKLDTRNNSPDQNTANEANNQTVQKKSATLREAASSFRFYSLGVLIFTARGIFSGYISYSLLYTVEKGLDLSTAAKILSFFSAIGMLGRILAAFIDRLPIPLSIQTFIDFTLITLGPLSLSFAKNVPTFALAAFFIGFGFGFENTLFPLLVPYLFGETYFSMIYGAYNLIGSAGATLAPIVVLALRNMTGSFIPGFLTMTASGFLSMALIYQTFGSARKKE